VKLSKIYFVLGFTFSLFGSQSPKEISIATSVVFLNKGSMVYCDQAYIKFCNQNGIQCAANEPFIPISYIISHGDTLYSTSDRATALRDIGEGPIAKTPAVLDMLDDFKKITHLPFSLFYDVYKEDSFKKEKTLLFQFKRIADGIHCTLHATLDSNFKENTPKSLMDQLSFKDRPHCVLAGQVNGGYVEIEPVEKELMEAGILAKVDGKIVHGLNGYFGPEEYNKKTWEYKKKVFFSYIKKPALGFSLLFIGYLLWIMYNIHLA